MENNKINIAEILRECPPGMELDCTMYDNVRLKYVSVFTDEDYPICIETKSGFDTKLTKYGQNVNLDDAKCVIFPKGKTTWEGFVPYQFKDGDIIVGKDSNCSYIAIFESFKNIEVFNYHVILTNFGSFKITGVANNANLRFATEEEKQKLFDVLKENGYYWDKRIKTVKALIIRPKFKVGDRIITKEGKFADIPMFITKVEEDCYDVYFKDSHGFPNYVPLNIKDQDDYELVSDEIKPKFKVGDKIKYRHGEIIYRIVKITEDTYVLDNFQSIPISIEYMYNLVPDKFDITTLKPFDSKVLVRNLKGEIWKPAIWGCYTDNGTLYHYATVGGCIYIYLIPYEGNEHLLGKNTDCDEYYKTWEG